MRLPQQGDLFVDRYRVEGVLGEGGFAVVFLATDVRSSRTVALKVLKPADGGYSAETHSRFSREARIVAALTDPHTITMFDQGRSSDGFLFMVFEHVPGVDLSELLAKVGRLPADPAIHILRQLLESLREAHAAGLLHRDLKPENVRVFEYMGDPLNVKLLDFGIARPAISHGELHITSSGEMVGTPRYMSPEQLLEQELGPPSDIYSLGLIAFELLMGRDVLQGNAWGHQLERLQAEHVFSIPMISSLPPKLRAVVERMTARNPQDRYQGAQEVLNALDAIGASAFADPFTPTEGIVAPAIGATNRPPPADTAPGETSLQPLDSTSWKWAVPIVAVLVLVIGFSAFRIATHPEPQQPLSTPTVAPVPMVVQPADTAPDSGPAVPMAPLPSLDAGPLADSDASMEKLDASTSVPGCGRDPEQTGTGGLRDEFDRDVVHIPKGYDPNREYPLVVLLHQDTKSPAEIMEQTRFPRLADREGFIVVAPIATDIYGAWGDRSDFHHVRDAVDAVKEQLCVDTERIYAVGHLLGGRMAERLSCEPWVAAIATNAHRREAGVNYCDDGRPIPYLHIAPMQSPRMPLQGGRGCVMVERISHKQYASFWRGRNQCTREEKRLRSPKGARCYEYECSGAPFVTCELAGGAGWPGRPDRPETTTEQPILGIGGCKDKIPKFPATERIWEFLESTAKASR